MSDPRFIVIKAENGLILKLAPPGRAGYEMTTAFRIAKTRAGWSRDASGEELAMAQSRLAALGVSS